MMMLAAEYINVPGLGAKWTIGSVALFHTAVASLGIGFAFIVTVLQIVGYRKKDRSYDILAKRTQLVHVCMYNIGTINAIGLVFVLSGLYPQFWSQIFVQFFWTMIIEEVLFLLLATTITLHYFFWDKLWGHKKLHIFLGALLTPLFFLQFYIINGMSGFMLTPGFAEHQATMNTPHLGWDKLGFYNPSFLMLTFHRALANISYGGFVVAGFCGVMLFRAGSQKARRFYERGGTAAFFTAFVSFLALPIVGYFYAMALKYFGRQSYDNLMFGRGDVVAGGIDWWWVKHVCVMAMLAMTLMYFRWRAKRTDAEAKTGFSMPLALVYAIGGFYALYYIGMGQVMTWPFMWGMFATAAGAGLIAWYLLKSQKDGSARMLFVVVGILSFLTVMFGGYVREASRPRFVNVLLEPDKQDSRLAHYDAVRQVFPPVDQQQYIFKKLTPDEVRKLREASPKPGARLAGPLGDLTVADRISLKCTGCHTLKPIKKYPHDDWNRVVWRMKAYGAPITIEEVKQLIDHLKAGKPY